MGRLAFLGLVGLGGVAILVALGVWQVQRLAWKEGVLADIEARIAADPVPLPVNPDPERDAYLPVTATGAWQSGYLRVLVSQKRIGAGYRIIRPLMTDSGTILVDLGFVRTAEVDALRFEEGGPVTVVGNLQWPREIDSFTPEPDRAGNIWFARDVSAMAEALDTRPLLLVRREAAEPGGPIAPLPVDTAAIPNDHLQYALTWFSLAAIWGGMTLYFLRRQRAANKA